MARRHRDLAGNLKEIDKLENLGADRMKILHTDLYEIWW
jgi:hypothetical protein